MLFGFIPISAQEFIHEPPEIKRVMEEFVNQNSDPEHTIEGYRILVVVSRDRRIVDSNLRQFKRYFPQFDVQMIYTDPYYKVITCAFRTQLDTQPVLIKIREEFPGSFEIKDKVTNEELNSTLKALLE